jgi:hypothetical protein
MIYQRCCAKVVSARGFDRKKTLFDRKQTFSDKKMPFRRLSGHVRWAYQFPAASHFSSGDTPMTRRNLFAAAAIVASVVLTACSDMTAPKGDAPCPVVSGSSTCVAK